jgi:hypothetical protein
MPTGKGKRSKGGEQGRARGQNAQDLAVIGATPAALARQAARAFQAFKYGAALLNVEVKHLDVSNQDAWSTTSSVILLSGIAQGDTQITRDGTSCKVVAFEFQARMLMSGSATATAVNFAIVVDTRGAGADPTPNSIFPASDVPFPAIDTDPGRFMVVHQQHHEMVLASATRAVYSGLIRVAALGGIHLTFEGTAGTVAECRGPTLFLWRRSSEATNTPSTDFRSRLYFVDN